MDTGVFMYNYVKNNLKIIRKYIINFVQMLLFSLAIGAFGGILGALFHKCIDMATELRGQKPSVLLFMPVGGIVIVVLYKVFASNKKVNTNLVISSLRQDRKIPLVMIPLIFVSTVISQLVGSSTGREGAALQLGGSLGYNAGRLFRLNADKIHVLTMTGMAAVFSALFGTPLTAAVFSLEVASVGLIDYTAFLPCVIASVAANKLAYLLGVSPVNFGHIVFDTQNYVVIKVAILSVMCAVLSIVFCVAVGKGTKLIKTAISNPYLRMVVCSAVLVLATFLLGSYDYNGAGMNIVERAMTGRADSFAFVLKILFTTVSLAAGFKGGEIVPAFFVGATFGCVVSPLIGLDPVLGAAIGFVALFCGVVNCPLASLILSVEVFGTSELILFAVCCGISYMLSGYFSLYRSQRIVYSKSDAHLIEKTDFTE